MDEGAIRVSEFTVNARLRFLAWDEGNDAAAGLLQAYLAHSPAQTKTSDFRLGCRTGTRAFGE